MRLSSQSIGMVDATPNCAFRACEPAVTLTIAARPGGRGGRIALIALACALGWSAVRYATHAFLPFDGVLVAAAAIGAGAGASVAPFVTAGRPWVPPVALTTLAAALAIAAPGYVSRHAGVHEFDAGLTRWFESQPGWRGGHRPLAVSPTVFAPLAGSSLGHRLTLIGASDSCATRSSPSARSPMARKSGCRCRR